MKLVCVTESHLTSEVSSSFVAIPKFTLLRNDVEGSVHKHGVCAYVHEDILVDNISSPASNVLMFQLLTYNVFIIIVYRPPSYNASQNEQLAILIENVTTGKECVVLGDFNLPNICWSSTDELPVASSVPPAEARFLDAVNSVGLVQWVTEPTYPRSGNTLDLLFTTEPDNIGKIEVLEPLPGCDHCPVLFEYLWEGEVPNKVEAQPSKHFAWHKGKYSHLCQELSRIDWDFELAFLNSSDAYDKFAGIVHKLTEESVPLRTAEGSRSGKPVWQKTLVG